MSEPIIKVEGLGKKYIISHEQRESYTALRDVISRKAKKLTSRGRIKTVREDFWAQGQFRKRHEKKGKKINKFLCIL